jgi:hypothetical protein
LGKTLDVGWLQVRRVRWHILRRGDEQDFADRSPANSARCLRWAAGDLYSHHGAAPR